VQSSDDSKEDVVAPLQYGTARVLVYPSRDELGAPAARHAADLIHQAILARGKARLVVATGNSQLNLIHALVEIPGVEWSRVEVFHVDESVGMPLTHPSSFRLWIKLLIEDKVHPAVVNYMARQPQLCVDLR
jgi:glucosamine-6-phosphate deaminase